MEKVVKNCLVLYEDDKPVSCIKTKIFKSDKEYLEFVELCRKNAEEIKIKKFKKEEELYTRIAIIERKLHNAELELAYNRGEITKEEYENGMVR